MKQEIEGSKSQCQEIKIRKSLLYGQKKIKNISPRHLLLFDQTQQK